MRCCGGGGVLLFAFAGRRVPVWHGRVPVRVPGQHPLTTTPLQLHQRTDAMMVWELDT